MNETIETAIEAVRKSGYVAIADAITQLVLAMELTAKDASQ